MNSVHQGSLVFCRMLCKINFLFVCLNFTVWGKLQCMFKKVETVDAVPLFHQIADYREKRAKNNLIKSCELQVIKVYLVSTNQQ